MRAHDLEWRAKAADCKVHLQAALDEKMDWYSDFKDTGVMEPHEFMNAIMQRQGYR